MITKHKLYKIALVSIVVVLMLVSTAGAMRFSDVIFKTDSTTKTKTQLLIFITPRILSGDYKGESPESSINKYLFYRQHLTFIGA